MKRINLHVCRTGLIKRYGYYKDLRAASCAKSLLEKSGWDASRIKSLPQVGEFYVYSSIRNHRPTVNECTFVTGDINVIRRK